MKIDEIKQLIQTVSESKLDEFDYEEKEVKLHMSKHPKHHPHHGPKPPMPGMCPPPEPAKDADHEE